MRIVRRYLFRNIIGMTALVLAVILSLAIFIEFVGQLDDTGSGEYGILQALMYALLKTPRVAFRVLPMATLLGALLGLGTLASNSEIIVLRAAGVSVARLSMAVGVTGAGLALFALLLGEFIAPPLDSYARQMRAMAKHGESGTRAASGAWVRDGDTIIRLGPQGTDYRYGGVYMFHMGDDGLTSISRADSAEIDESEQWVLNNYEESRFDETGVETAAQRRAIQPYSLNAEVLELMIVRSSSLTGAGLYRYIQYLRDNELDASRYELAFWERVATAASVLPMCLLALPFAFRNLRSGGTGARLLIGVMIGLAYFLLSSTLADGAAVFQVSPVIVAWSPVAVLSLVVVFMLRRLR